MLRKFLALFKPEERKTGLYNVLLMNGDRIRDVKIIFASSRSDAMETGERLYGGTARDAKIFHEIQERRCNTMKEYHLCTGVKGNANYEITDILAYSIEEAIVKAAVYLGWKFNQISERF